MNVRMNPTERTPLRWILKNRGNKENGGVSVFICGYPHVPDRRPALGSAACYRRDARKANKHIAQGVAMGKGMLRERRGKSTFPVAAIAPSGP